MINRSKIYLQNIKELTKIFPKIKSQLIESILKDIPVEYTKNSINIVFVSSKYIQELNLDFRNKDYITDVLSFNIDSTSLLGEIYICPEYIKNNIPEEKHLEELLRLIIHGILHLNNYDHTIEFIEGKFQNEEMYVVQENILNKLMKKIL